MSKLEAILFDLDGTLVESNRLISESYRKTFLLHYPEMVLSESDISAMIGPPLKAVFEKMNPDPEHVQAMIDTYLRFYRQMEFDTITLYPYVIELLDFLKASGYKIAIVTTKFKASALPSIQHFGIDRYLDLLIGLDDVLHHKPHPEPIEKALKHLGCHHALMVGDNPSDILSGKNAGILTCAVSWSEKKADIELLRPDCWIDDFRQLIEFVRQEETR